MGKDGGQHQSSTGLPEQGRTGGLSSSLQAAVTEDNRLVAYKHHLFLRGLEAGKSKMKVPADSVPGEAWPLAGRLSSCVLVFSHGRKRQFSPLPLLRKTLIPP